MLYLIYASGIAWLVPMLVLSPCIVRIWRNKSDYIDITLGLVWFMAANQFGYCLRWSMFHDAVSSMGSGELIMWSGLYTLSILLALTSVGVWRIVRRKG